MKNRFITQSSGSFFLFGPRGTGKSTWLEAALPEAYTVNLLLADVRRQLSGNPERLHSIVAEHPDKSVFVIDEIQRVPDLLDSVHDIMEKSPHLKFVLTGSSARKLKRAGKDTDMLGGRAVKRTCARVRSGGCVALAVAADLWPLACGCVGRPSAQGVDGVHLPKSVQHAIVRRVRVAGREQGQQGQGDESE